MFAHILSTHTHTSGVRKKFHIETILTAHITERTRRKQETTTLLLQHTITRSTTKMDTKKNRFADGANKSGKHYMKKAAFFFGRKAASL